MSIDTIRLIVADHARLSVDAANLAPGDDLYAAGLTSHASVSLMLALEDAFDVEFPEHLLNRATFASIGAINAAIESLTSQASAN